MQHANMRATSRSRHQSNLYQDEDWTEEEKLHQGFKADEYAFLSEMLGPRGVAFDNDEALEGHDDEDLKNDPVSTMDMRVRCAVFLSFTAAGRSTDDWLHWCTNRRTSWAS